MSKQEYIISQIQNSETIGRKESFIFTMLEVYKRWQGTPINIVETGTTRKKEGENVMWDGGSTILWGWWSKITGGKAWTCDISPENIHECKRWTAEYKDFISYHAEDSIKFLAEFNEEIHLLYLDSYDTSEHDQRIIDEACNHQLREVNMIYNNLREDSLILLDDVRADLKGGKSGLSIPYLQSLGWKIINHDTVNQQVLLSK